MRNYFRRALALILSGLPCCALGQADCAAAAQARVRQYDAAERGARRYDSFGSLGLDIECNHRSSDGHQASRARLWLRAAQHDSSWSYADVRELIWSYSNDALQVRAGVDQVFWGVTEFAHIVDVINQSDVLEDPFGETKSGQPLASAAWRGQWGVLTGLVLPRFRDRRFPDLGEPLRAAPPVALGPARFEAPDGRKNTDWAARYSISRGAVDLGLSYFEGTSRDPLFGVSQDPGATEQWYAWYPQMQQWAIDLQLTVGEWLIKFEGAERVQHQHSEHGYSVGLERTITSFSGSPADLTTVIEYVRDDRAPPPVPGFLQDDWSIGLRLAVNDAGTSEARLGVIVDRTFSSRAWAAQYSTRFAQRWRVEAQARVFSGVASRDPLSALRSDSYIDLAFTHYF